MFAAPSGAARVFPAQYTDGSGLLAQQTLEGGFGMAVYGPSTTTANQATTLTVLLAAPAAGRIVFGLAAVAYEHTAVGQSYGAFPYGNYCPASGAQCKQFLTSSPVINWTSPLAMLAPPTVKAPFGAFLDSVVAPNAWLRPPEDTLFTRPNDADWRGACFVADETLARIEDAGAAPGGATTVAITCPLLMRQADASVVVWLAARGVTPEGPLRLTKCLPVSLTTSHAPPLAAAPQPTQAPVVTSPKEGDRVGPNFEVIGSAQPGAVVVISTDVLNNETGALIRSVPGNRHLPDLAGAFSLRIAAPRVPNEALARIRYQVHIRSEGVDFKSPETIINVFPKLEP
jgi:hypothetical protein